MRIKDYQSNRNKYTPQVFPTTGKRITPCVEHWWDVRGRCVFCGVPKAVALAQAVDAVRDVLETVGYRP